MANRKNIKQRSQKKFFGNQFVGKSGNGRDKNIRPTPQVHRLLTSKLVRPKGRPMSKARHCREVVRKSSSIQRTLDKKTVPFGFSYVQVCLKCL